MTVAAGTDGDVDERRSIVGIVRCLRVRDHSAEGAGCGSANSTGGGGTAEEGSSCNHRNSRCWNLNSLARAMKIDKRCDTALYKSEYGLGLWSYTVSMGAIARQEERPCRIE
jgi:hypothetical protein